MEEDAKSLIKWGRWLQNIHKVILMGTGGGWVVKELRGLLIRLGGFEL
jgi:hypothetical protein